MDKLVYNVLDGEFSTSNVPDLPSPSIEDVRVEKFAELKCSVMSMLSPTDYVIVKIQEAAILSQDTSSLISSYSTEFAYRQSVRSWNTTQESAIASATTIEELNAIDVTSGPQS